MTSFTHNRGTNPVTINSNNNNNNNNNNDKNEIIIAIIIVTIMLKEALQVSVSNFTAGKKFS